MVQDYWFKKSFPTNNHEYIESHFENDFALRFTTTNQQDHWENSQTQHFV